MLRFVCLLFLIPVISSVTWITLHNRDELPMKVTKLTLREYINGNELLKEQVWTDWPEIPRHEDCSKRYPLNFTLIPDKEVNQQWFIEFKFDQEEYRTEKPASGYFDKRDDDPKDAVIISIAPCAEQLLVSPPKSPDLYGKINKYFP